MIGWPVCVKTLEMRGALLPAGTPGGEKFTFGLGWCIPNFKSYAKAMGYNAAYLSRA